MDDSHTGVFGLIAIVVVLLLKIHALEGMDLDRWRTLLVAPILGRWAMVLFAYRAKAAKDGLGLTLVDDLHDKHVLLATVLTLLLVATIWRVNGIVMMAVVALLPIASQNTFIGAWAALPATPLASRWRIERDLGHGFVGSVNTMNRRKQIITVYLLAVSLIVCTAIIFWQQKRPAATSDFPCAQCDRNTICVGFWRSRGGCDNLLRLSTAAARRLPRSAGLLIRVWKRSPLPGRIS